MDQPYIGVIFAHAGTFAPVNWMLCQGQTIAISTNDALYALIGTTFGGDGVNTFNLPDLRGRVPVGQGQGQGTSNYVLGQSAGVEQVTVSGSQLAVHTHLVNAVNTAGDTVVPTSASAISGTGTLNFYDTSAPAATLAAATVSPSGNSQPLSIVQPVLAVNYIMAMAGIFPSRS